MGYFQVRNDSRVVIYYCRAFIRLTAGFEAFLKKNWANPGLFFVYFCSFSNTIFTEKIVDFSGIRTQIFVLEGEHADHLTTTTALALNFTFQIFSRRAGRPPEELDRGHERAAAFGKIRRLHFLPSRCCVSSRFALESYISVWPDLANFSEYLAISRGFYLVFGKISK